MNSIHHTVKMNHQTILDPSISRDVASALLSIEAVKLDVKNPFTWVSGISSPVYCDNRRINSFVETRNSIVNSFVEIIKGFFSDVDIIAGVATGGIPMGILIAERLGLPFIYVRQQPKNHGLKRQVEGHWNDGDKVVLIEDHVSTGGSSLKAIEGLRTQNIVVEALISIMTYNFDQSIELFKKHEIKHVSLSDLDTILEVAFDKGQLIQADCDEILKFRKAPSRWLK